MRKNLLFSRVSLVWMIICQTLYTIGLWYQESDCPELLGSRLMAKLFMQLLAPSIIVAIAFALVGSIILALSLRKDPRFGPDAALALSGMAYAIMVPISAFLLWTTLDDLYLPPPGPPQLLRIGALVVMDIVVVFATKRFFQTRVKPRPQID